MDFTTLITELALRVFQYCQSLLSWVTFNACLPIRIVISITRLLP